MSAISASSARLISGRHDVEIGRLRTADVRNEARQLSEDSPGDRLSARRMAKVAVVTGAGTGIGQQMIAQGNGGRIFNISSIHEDLPLLTNAPHCASKGGLRMLMRTIAVELVPHKITVNNIGPGAA